MDSYLPITEAAKKVNLSTKDLNQLVTLGKIKSVMMGKQILLRESDVMALSLNQIIPTYLGNRSASVKPLVNMASNRPTISRWKDKGLYQSDWPSGEKDLIG